MEASYNLGSSSYTITTAPLQSEMAKAGFWRRLPAFLIDIILLQILKEIIISPLKSNLGIDEASFASIEDIVRDFESFIIYGLFSMIVYIIISGFYFTLFYGSTGQSIGKKIMGLKVIPAAGGTMTYRKAFVRYIGYLISEIPLFLGFIWIAFDKDKQGWHDKIAGTYVVKTG
jgi:uncharacterized RDD family membrane protein YckC